MFIDNYLQKYGYYEKHQIIIKASKESIWKAFKTLTISDMSYNLFSKINNNSLFVDFMKSRFILLEESENEILVGLIGKFWINKTIKVNRGEFENFRKLGYAKLIWSISINEIDSKNNILRTETRVECDDRHSNNIFRIYWFFIKPFSGLTRIYLLNHIKNKIQNNVIHYDKNNI